MIAAFENAVLKRLRDAGLGEPKAVLPYKWGALESYPENWDLYLKDKGVIKTPAAWVVFGGWRQPVTRADGIVQAPATFMLVIAAENLRNETAQRHGGVGPKEPGSYQLMLDAVRLLSGHQLVDQAGAELDVSRITIGASRSIRPTQALIERKWSMFAVELNADLYIDPAFAAGEPDDFAAFHVNWDAAPFADRPDSLPADDQADFTDHLTLETENP